MAEGKTPLYFIVCIRWRWVVSCITRSL